VRIAGAQPPRRRGRPEGSGNAAVTRANIIRAAVFCFAQTGYAQTANRDIARAAGVTTGSLYHYFDGKAAIYEEALRQCTVTLVETYRSACTDAAEQSCVDQLCLCLERVIRLSREWPGIIRFAGNAAAEIRHNRELGWLQQDVALAFPDFFRELMQRARERGELGGDVIVDEAAELLLVLISGLSTSHATDEREEQFVARVRTFERLLRGQLLYAPDGPAIPGPANAPQ
jgi:AcrR family transcriptional regulator